MNDTERWIVEYFREHGELEGLDPEGMLEANYFELELLDSLGIVQMIVGLEDDFGVQLESQHMQDPRFCTIKGLAELVEEAGT